MSSTVRLIETDEFQFEFLSRLAERESWRKELHRPIYHVHKWWANRLGSVFRGILLGSVLPANGDLTADFYRDQSFAGTTVFDPFMGSGTTIGEAHKLGFTALGRDINPVAVSAVRTSLGPMERRRLQEAFHGLSETVGRRIGELYRAEDAQGRACDVLYFFWVMQTSCPGCASAVDLFSSQVFARSAAPKHKHKVHTVCPNCGAIDCGDRRAPWTACHGCGTSFDASQGNAHGKKATCPKCQLAFDVAERMLQSGMPPSYRPYAKLVLNSDGTKQYLPFVALDQQNYSHAVETLEQEVSDGTIRLPSLALEHGYNTRQAMRYGFNRWIDFFNPRQLLALSWLKIGIEAIDDDAVRAPLLTLFSGCLEFHNRFASYKGEGTGAVRHMFSHHILKPERMPIEAHVWGTPKSSGSFSGLFRSRLLKALDYREHPTELVGTRSPPRVCSPAFSGRVEAAWPLNPSPGARRIYLSCGDSSKSCLAPASVDLVVTDPPFFDNVFYSELADFFYAWQQGPDQDVGQTQGTTRCAEEIQDSDEQAFSIKLTRVFSECHRVLKDDGILVFTYHHSRDAGWRSLADAIFKAEFRVANVHPVKSEMSVATPKSQANSPIQLDVIIVCRKANQRLNSARQDTTTSLDAGLAKLARLRRIGFELSENDCRVTLLGQLLTAIRTSSQIDDCLKQVDELIRNFVDHECEAVPAPQQMLFS